MHWSLVSESGSLSNVIGESIQYTAITVTSNQTVKVTASAESNTSKQASIDLMVDASAQPSTNQVQSLDGSTPADLRVITPLGEGTPLATSGTTNFIIEPNQANLVGVIDSKRNFGWTAILPAWTETATTPDEAMIGSVSSAVHMVKTASVVYQSDPAALKSIVTLLRPMTEIKTLATTLENHQADAEDAPFSRTRS